MRARFSSDPAKVRKEGIEVRTVEVVVREDEDARSRKGEPTAEAGEEEDRAARGVEALKGGEALGT